MKWLVKYKESFLATLQYVETRVVRVQSEISKSLWPNRRDTPKRQVQGYWPKGYFLPKALTQSEDRDIRLSDNEAGYSWFSSLSREFKTKYLLRKFYPELPPLIVPGKSSRGGWFVPCFSSVREDLRPNLRANRYLAHQERRISEAIAKGNFELSTRIWTILAQRSKAFRVSSLNSTKCTRGWYHKIPKFEFDDLMNRVGNIMKTWNCNVKYFRVYIPKPDGVRFRPLGVPSKAWAIVLHMIYRYLVLVIKDKISSRQFGFLPKRNGVQAWRKILDLRKEGYVHMYEFDLDGCFNRISVAWTLKLLKDIGLPSYFVFYMENILTNMPIAKELKEEVELRKLRNMTVKSGLPQGFNISPLLSILVIDAAFKAIKVDPILYADDGIIMSKERIDLTQEQIDMLDNWGLVLSKKVKKDGTPSCRWIEDEFTFLNIHYSISRDAFLIEDSPDKFKWIPSRLMTDNLFWRDLEIYAGNEDWEWEIDSDCYALHRKSVSSLSNWLLMKRWIEGSKMVRRCGLLFIDVQKESSLSSMRLLSKERKRTRSPYSIKMIQMHRKYLVPFTRLHKVPMPLPSIQAVYPYPEYLDPIRIEPTIWYRIDQEKRQFVLHQVFGLAAFNEMNLTSWRNNTMFQHHILNKGSSMRNLRTRLIEL